MPRQIDNVITGGSVTAAGHLHVVLLSVRKDVLDRDEDPIEIAVSADEAFMLAANLITYAKSALQRQLWDTACGECETCGNSRFVIVYKPGHERVGSREHCPDCVPRGQAPIPTMAAWAPLMQAVR